MTITLLQEATQKFEQTQLDLIDKVIHSVLFHSGFFSRYIRDEEYHGKRQKDKDVDRICKMIVDNFSDRTDERKQTYHYCLRDVSYSNLGCLALGILSEFDKVLFKDCCRLRLALRNAIYRADPRSSSLMDELFPLK